MVMIITLLQEKGGAGKTTTTMNLAGRLKELGKKVKVVDVNDEQRSATKWANRGGYFNSMVINISDKHFKKEIEKISSGEKLDFIIIDTPPELMTAAMKAALLSHLLIIPCSPSSLDLEAAEDTVEIAETTGKPFWLLASDVAPTTSVGKKLPEILGRLGKVFKTVIHNRVSIVEAAMEGTWVGAYAPESKAHNEYKQLTKEVLEALKEIKK